MCEDEIMSESILNSLKPGLNVEIEDKSFDTEILMHINSAIAILTQLGVGPKKGFRVRNESTTWKEFLGNDDKLAMTKDYIYMKVKLIFDPPTSATVINMFKESIKEYEWRSNVAVEDEEVDL